jgi:hypothetical protein
MAKLRREERACPFGNHTARDRHPAQQPGVRQVADFLARTKALMNLPLGFKVVVLTS